MSDDKDRLTLKLPKSDMDEVRKMAAESNITVDEFLLRALGTELFLKEHIKKGAKILVKRRFERPREVEFS